MPSPDVLHMQIDQSRTFRPSKIFYLRTSSEKAIHSSALDLTATCLSSFGEDFSPEFHELVQVALRANPSFSPTWQLAEAHHHRWSDTRLVVSAASSGVEVAQFHSALLSFGASHIHFPVESTHCSHEITVRPLSLLNRAQAFVKDSITYVWETPTVALPRSSSSSSKLPGRRKVSLYKAVSSKKVEIARYESASGKFELNGVLALEEREIDPLVAVLTLVGVLQQNDTFYCPGLDLVGK